MFGSAVVEVAIGLVFVFFLASSIAFHINEFVARFFGWRARDLEDALHEMLRNDSLVHNLFKHTLIGTPDIGWRFPRLHVCKFFRERCGGPRAAGDA